MTTAHEYINRVIARMPSATPLRSQIALELQGTIAERLANGQSIDEVIRQLGDPGALADSFLAAVPLVPASFWSRVVAKLLDVLLVLVVLLPIVVLVCLMVVGDRAPWQFSAAIGFAVTMLLAPIYTIVSEYKASCTLGKWLMGLRVVRESGARIGLGQAVVRQLAAFAQVFLIDCLFALFTEKHQRAFELLSKTRVVQAGK